MDEESGLLKQSTLRESTYQSTSNAPELSVESESVETNSLSSSWLQATKTHVRKLLSIYDDKLNTHPILTKCITAFFILGFGDLCGQLIDQLRGNLPPGIDWIRYLRFALFGMAGAPYTHYYFTALDAWLPPTEEPCSKTTAIKVFIDQFVQAPIFVAVTIVALGILKGEGFAGLEQDLHEKYMPTLWINWKLWIPASAINLAFVPPRFRVLYVNMVFFWWGIILSIMLNG